MTLFLREQKTTSHHLLQRKRTRPTFTVTGRFAMIVIATLLNFHLHKTSFCIYRLCDVNSLLQVLGLQVGL